MARVLVTGCSSGIGRAAAEALAARGHTVIATARDSDKLRGLNVAMTLPLDVTDDASVTSAVGRAGEVDVLVNNAGVTVVGPIELVNFAEIRQVMETNFFGPLRLMRAVLPQMRGRRAGRILNVSSTAAQTTFPALGYYSASKRALEAATEALRVEVGHLGIDVCLVEYGAVDSAFARNRLVTGRSEADYGPLSSRVDSILASLRRDPMTSSAAGAAIAELVDDDRVPLRFPVGAASQILDSRRSQTDAEWQRSVEEMLGLVDK